MTARMACSSGPSFLKASPPTTLEGIERYLGSGMIRGIGAVYARRLVQAFGDRVFDLIEQQPERLREVAGIGPLRAARIIAGWAEQKAVREIMLFLHANGVGTSRAAAPPSTAPCWPREAPADQLARGRGKLLVHRRHPRKPSGYSR